jgi:outer membrane immunogenic protein
MRGVQFEKREFVQSKSDGEVSMFRRLLMSSVSLVAFSAAASAADIYRAPEVGGYKDGPAYVIWSGFYAGADIGWGNGDAKVNIPAYPYPNHSQSGDGVVGGGYIGYNYQLGRFVVGVEGDFSGTNVTSLALSGNGGTEKYKVDEQWRASLRGRLGYTFDRAMIYATAGGAWTDIQTQYAPPAGGVKSATLDGFIVGGGVEYALTPNWFGRVEYLFADYDKAHFVHLGPSSVDYQTNEVRVGLSYKFGPTFEPLK